MAPISYSAAYSDERMAPIPHRFPQLSMTQGEKARYREESTKEYWQRNKLGYTVQELIDCKEMLLHFSDLYLSSLSNAVCKVDIHSDRELKPTTLTNPLGPLFRKERWETQESIKELRNYNWPEYRRKLHPMSVNYTLPYEGNWEANNPHLWKMMEPSLRLAERLLMGTQTLQHVRTYTLSSCKAKEQAVGGPYGR